MNGGDTSSGIAKKIDSYLATLSKIYGKYGTKQLQQIVVNSNVSVQEAWRDVLDFGEYFCGYEIHLYLPESLYLASFKQKDELQDKLKMDISSFHHVKNESIDEVLLEMDVSEESDWRKESNMQLGEDTIMSSTDERRIWGDGGFRVFLSHKSEVKQQTADLKDQLKMYGVSCFVAHEDIKPTYEWQNEIENALFSMDALVALLTEDFHDSVWTDQEVGFAFGRGVPIISVRLGKDPYGFIGKFQALSCSWESAAEKIVSILVKYDKMVDAYINAVKNCENYNDANILSEILPNIITLSDQQVAILISAFNDNVQVRNSYGFTGKKSFEYGEGLVYHLNRLNDGEYEYTEDWMIRAKQ
ncbi:MAG: toll/interleukin-1 receptor domain-containing protein [Methanosarcinaceae archaeon]|nr:toll/interleukin-1 receptor domain-containing protein [Methanosarcinaceae archaeon]